MISVSYTHLIAEPDGGGDHDDLEHHAEHDLHEADGQRDREELALEIEEMGISFNQYILSKPTS